MPYPWLSSFKKILSLTLCVCVFALSCTCFKEYMWMLEGQLFEVTSLNLWMKFRLEKQVPLPTKLSGQPLLTK